MEIFYIKFALQMVSLQPQHYGYTQHACTYCVQVRKAVAENLYVLLLSQQDSHPGLEGLATDAACDVLCESVWDGPLLEAKIARDALYDLLQLRPASCSKQDRARGEATIRWGVIEEGIPCLNVIA